MSQPSPARVFTATLVDALEQLGLRHVCISPGARNLPLSLAFAASSVRVWVHHDERSSGFFALGLARELGEPVALNCTSGSAATHFHPAVVEAKASRVPLLVMTADRPPELRNVGAPQTIDQIDLYGTAVKWFHDAGVPDTTSAETAHNLAAHAWAIATDTPPGPVHLNFPFREPLMVEADSGVAATSPEPTKAHRGQTIPPDRLLNEIADDLGGSRPLIVVGALSRHEDAAAIVELARVWKAPIHADPLSGLRHGPHDLANVIGSSDLLASAGWLDEVQPDRILRIGGLPTSKPLWRWLEAEAATYQVVVDPAGWRDPLGSADVILRGDTGPTATALAKLVAPAADSWLSKWHSADERVQAMLEDRFAGAGTPSEPAVARIVSESATGRVGVASSMPIRDVDAFGVVAPEGPRYLGNRGTNGIDGLLSMTLGAIAGSGTPGYALAGDLSALHDLSALATAARLDLPLTVIVVNNDGGGIFHFLPMAEYTDDGSFELVFGTPHGTDFVPIAGAMGVAARRIDDVAELREAIATPADGPRLIQVDTDRVENLELHRSMVDAVRALLR